MFLTSQSLLLLSEFEESMQLTLLKFFRPLNFFNLEENFFFLFLKRLFILQTFQAKNSEAEKTSQEENLLNFQKLG